jgi:phage tail-like protein
VLWKWFDRALADGKLERHNVSIILYNSDRTKMRQWDLKEAFPVKWTGPDFQSDSNQIAMESIELVHHGLEMQPWTAARARR